MHLPQIKKRISGFLLNEEGRISKETLVTMGAFVAGAGLLGVRQVEGWNGGEGQACGGWDTGTDPEQCWDCHSNCPNPSNSNVNVEKGCDQGTDGCSDIKPGLNWHQDALKDHNAYDADGNQVRFGTGKCSDDHIPFHFNGVHFSYAGSTLTTQHHHHASHNSY